MLEMALSFGNQEKCAAKLYINQNNSNDDNKKNTNI